MFMRKNSAFTMIEILIVLAIIGFLFAFLLGPQLMKMFGKSDVAITQLRMKKVRQALVQYKMDMGHYPSKREGGIRALIDQPSTPSGQKWKGPYVDDDEDLEDKWDNEFEYNIPPVKYKYKFRIFEIISPGLEEREGESAANAVGA